MVATVNKFIGGCLVAVATAAVCFAQTKMQKSFSVLENKYFGRTFEHDTDVQRTERLESFIYGEPVKGDIAQRMSSIAAAAAIVAPPVSEPVANLESQSATGTADGLPPDQVQDAFHEKTRPNYTHYDAAAKPRETKAATQDYPRITALEKAILGRTFAGRPLPERLSRMEKKAFGAPSEDSDFGKRADNLEVYARQKLHIGIAQGNGESGGKQKQSADMQQVAGMLGRTLLGLAGIPGGGVGSSTGGPGFGPRMGPGFNNSVMQSRQQTQEMKDEAAQREEEILLKSPPPAPQAKLLMKVSWCEMRIFGQTYRDMHLPDRLTQLNEQVHFSAGTGVDLMDHINDLIKKAQSMKPVNRPLAKSSDSEDE